MIFDFGRVWITQQRRLEWMPRLLFRAMWSYLSDPWRSAMPARQLWPDGKPPPMAACLWPTAMMEAAARVCWSDNIQHALTCVHCALLSLFFHNVFRVINFTRPTSCVYSCCRSPLGLAASHFPLARELSTLCWQGPRHSRVLSSARPIFNGTHRIYPSSAAYFSILWANLWSHQWEAG